MKTKIIILFILLPMGVFGQKANSLMLSFQPQDLGVGLRYDRLGDKVGAYTSLSWGNHNLPFERYLKDHVKGVVGLLVRAKEPDSYFTLGMVYAVYGDIYVEGIEDTFNPNVLKPWSLEIGITTNLNGLIVGIRYDIIKIESSIDIGIRF